MKTKEEIIAYINSKIEYNQFGYQYDRYSFGVGVAKALFWTFEIDHDTYNAIIEYLEGE